MRVLMISQVFAPEMGAAANRLSPIVRELVAAGHEVHVATGMPNYPQGVIKPGYENLRRMTETIDGATVHRTSHFIAPRNTSNSAQIRNYLSFLPAAVRSGLRAPKPDVVFVTSPPIFPALVGISLARLYGAKLVFDIRDLWPDEIIACGGSGPNSIGIRLIRKLERWTYRSADVVSCTTHPFIQAVTERGVPSERAIFVPNGADLDLFRPKPYDHALAESLGLADRFKILYSGLLGIKHGLENVLDAMALLPSRARASLILAGSGARDAALRDYARQKGLTNVHFLGEWPVDALPRLISAADVCVSCLKPEPYLEKIISVKIFEYMACARPVVVAQSGETARIVTESGGGVAVPPGSPHELASAFVTLSESPKARARMGENGLAYVHQHYSRKASAQTLIQAMERTLESPRPIVLREATPDLQRAA